MAEEKTGRPNPAPGPAPEPAPGPAPAAVSRPLRLVYLALGWGFFGLGVAGVFLPVVPTTPFMILALWGFSNSSPRLRAWLYSHRLFGPPLQRWSAHRVIPPAAKMTALAAMAASLAYMGFFTETPWPWLAATAALMAIGAGYVLTKPGHAPPERRDK